jgi:hypothetical protein
MIKAKSGKYKHVCWMIIFVSLVMVGRAAFITLSSPSETPPLYLNGRVVMK